MVLSGLRRSSRRQYRHNTDRLDRRAERGHVSSHGRIEDAGVHDVRAGELLQDARRGAGAGRRVRRLNGRSAESRTGRRPELHVLAEPSERRPRHRWQDAHDGRHSACRGGCCAGSLWWSPGVYRLGPLRSARTASASSRPYRRRRRRKLSRRPLEGVAEHSRPAVAWRQRSAGECRGCRGHRAVGQGVSSDQRVQGRDRRGVRPARHSPAPATQNHSDRGAHAHRHGAARRLAEHLRHDAGSRRDA